MSLHTAIKIIEQHQQWREGLELEMVQPHKLTEALKIIIKHCKATEYANV